MQLLPLEVWRVVEQYLCESRIHVSCTQSRCHAAGRVVFLKSHGIEVYMDETSTPWRFDFGWNETQVFVFGVDGLSAEAMFGQTWTVTPASATERVCMNVADVLVTQRSPLHQIVCPPVNSKN